MKKTVTSVLGATLLVAAGAGASYAGEISTPIIFLGSGTQLVCVGSNVSTGPITMTVKIVGGVSDATQTCNLAANDRNGCQAFLNGQLGHCRISVSTLTSGQVRASVRGVLFNRTTASPFTVFNTVDAR